MHRAGDSAPHGESNPRYHGSGDPAACVRILNELVRKAEPSDCHPKPCGIGNFYQPTIHNITFYAVGSFRYALKAVGAVSADDVFVPRTGFEKAAEFCTKVRLCHSLKLVHCNISPTRSLALILIQTVHLYRASKKNCAILFLQQLCQAKVYFDNFWQAYTSVNFLSHAYFIFFIKSKAEDQLKFHQLSAPALKRDQRVTNVTKI